MAEPAEQIGKRAVTERHQQAEAVYRRHWYTTPSGTTIDDVMTPDYWERVAKTFQPLDRIEIVDDDGTYFLELLVLDTAGGLRLSPLRGLDLSEQTIAPRGMAARSKTGTRAVYKGPYLKWCAIRGDVALKDKFETESQCLHWIAGHASEK